MAVVLGKVTAAEIKDTVRRIPVFQEMLEAVRLAGKAGAEQAVVSDANTVKSSLR